MSADLNALFLAACRRHGARPAVVDGGGALSHAGLLARAQAVARRLKAAGVRPKDRVALHAERGADAVAAVHGALLAGAAYVPIDAQAPWGRVSDILADCRPRALLTSRPAPAGAGLPVIPLSEAARGEGGGAAARVRGSDPAYVLYTSGSTGRPKGIVITHGGALAFSEWARRTFDLRPSDRVANLASFQFDLSVFDLFSTRAAGASLHPVPYPDALFAPRVAAFLAQRKATVLYTVPSVLASIAAVGGRRRFPALRLLLFAGEVMPPPLLEPWRRLAPRARRWNLYGPTETNVCLAYRVPPGPWPAGRPVPIGRPAAGAEVVAVDGELLVRGPAVMAGYLGRRGAGFARVPGKGAKPFYRTGDSVVLGEDGEYRYLGRGDGQVKVRGYRVELGEVEAALQRQPSVAQAAVVVSGEGPSASLAAFVVPRRRAFSGDRLLEALSAQLPRYMVPARLETVESLPRLVSGKVDRLALSRGSDGGAAQRVRRAAAALLKGRALSDEDSFWDTGAIDSLELLQLVHYLEMEFGFKIPERDVSPEIFSSIAAVGRYLDRRQAAGAR